MKRQSLIFACILYGCFVSAQDIITMNDGTDIQAKVTQVGQSQVSYKKYSNPDGPTYTISLSDIIMITYQNGEREMYNNINAEKNSTIPQGIMTYNEWSGKISIGGVTIGNEMWDMYFTPEDLKTFKSGKTGYSIGTFLGCIGAVPLGWSIGYYAAGGMGGDETQKTLLIGGGIAFIGGFIISSIGNNQMKKAISNYNHSILAFQPELRFFSNGNDIGLGIALLF